MGKLRTTSRVHQIQVKQIGTLCKVLDDAQLRAESQTLEGEPIP